MHKYRIYLNIYRKNNMNIIENYKEPVIKPEINGFVYFAYHPDLYKKNIHHIKIGMTKNLDKRLKQLQTGSSFKLMFYKTYQSFDYKKIENNLHKKYKDKQVLNEWFNIDLNEVDKILHELDPENNPVISWFDLIKNKLYKIWPFKK